MSESLARYPSLVEVYQHSGRGLSPPEKSLEIRINNKQSGQQQQYSGSRNTIDSP